MDPQRIPYHLGLPLAASLLFAIGLLFVKQASQRGIGALAVTLIANLCGAVLFSGLWWWGGPAQPWSLYWQPAVVALLYVVGQATAFLAVARGDVSIAAPILSTKVLMVAVFVTWIAHESLSIWTWLAAGGATLGVALIQRSSQTTGSSQNAAFSVVCALISATDFALFDVLVQRWSPRWGAGRFLPTVFWIAAIWSLPLVVHRDARTLRTWSQGWPALLGGLFIGLQAMCIVLALALYGDAARVNIVYSLRGLWGVALAWVFAHWLGSGEALVSSATMRTRLLGAVFVTAAVVVAVIAGQH